MHKYSLGNTTNTNCTKSRVVEGAGSFHLFSANVAEISHLRLDFNLRLQIGKLFCTAANFKLFCTSANFKLFCTAANLTESLWTISKVAIFRNIGKGYTREIQTRLSFTHF